MSALNSTPLISSKDCTSETIALRDEIEIEIEMLRKQIEASQQARRLLLRRQKRPSGVRFALDAEICYVNSSFTGSPLAPTQEQTRAARIDEQLQQDTKGGWLFNFGRRSFFSQTWKRTWVVVDSERISWFRSEADSKALDSVPLYIETTNSRGSKFKNPAVCFPFVSEQECSKAIDAAVGLEMPKHLFGIQYLEKDKHEFLVLCADSEEEKEEWVAFITKYIKMYIPLGMNIKSNPRAGSDHPLHQKVVLGGEAPKSEVRF